MIIGCGKRRGQAARFVLLVVLSALPRPSASGPLADEYSIKAAFLFHFAEFVDWPDEAFKDSANTMIYCSIGENGPMRSAMEASLLGKAVHWRTVQLRQLRDWQSAAGCHVLYVGANENKRLLPGLDALKGSPVLTVGEADNFAEIGGMIQFCEESNKIRFHINLTPVASARLKMSSRLLSLAKTVIGTAGGN